MHKIKCRAKAVSNGEWIYGVPYSEYMICGMTAAYYSDEVPISKYIEFCYIKIDPTTVGRYIELPDKNGKEIYTGDIIQFCDIGEEGYEYKECYDFTNIAVVIFNNGRVELNNFFGTNSSVIDDMNGCHEDFMLVFETAEIIGNVHDTPNLLEKN